MSSLMVSTSGIRGIVGDSLTPELATRVGCSYGSLIGKGPVVIGGDTRVSHDCVMSAVISGLLSVGTDVITIGKVTTPTVQQLIKHHKAKGGLVITASHNPIMWNGIKLMNETGSFLSDSQYKSFMSLFESNTYTHQPWDRLGTLSENTDALQIHVDLILSKIDVSAIQNSGLRVLIDPNNGTGALANPILMDHLGVSYTMINKEPNGRFAHDPEPLQKNLDQIITELKTGQYDIGFVQDADADRLVILDETGRFIGEDYSLGLCVDYVLKHEQSSAPQKDVVVNLSTSNVIADIVKKNGGSLHQTRIGEPNVTAKLKELDAVVGGEGNGGVIYPEVGWGRDSLVGIVLALNYLAKSKKKVSELVQDYPAYSMLRDKITLTDKGDITTFLHELKTHFNQYELNEEDGVKVILPTGWIHVRPSNTEPIVRVFIEEQSSDKANSLLQEVMTCYSNMKTIV